MEIKAEQTLTEDEIKTRLVQYREKGGTLVVTDAASYEAACGYVVQGQKTLKWIDKYWEGPIRKGMDLLNELRGKKKDMENMVHPIIAEANDKAIAWKRTEEKRAREEAVRIQAEEKQKAEESALKIAEALEKQGRPAAAAAALERAEMRQAPPVQAAIPKAAGTYVKTTFIFRLVNPALVKDEYKIPDESAINKVVKALGKKAEALVGGIEVEEKQDLVPTGR